MNSTLPFRLAVFDMDDTLLGPNRQISVENISALQRLRSSGVEVIIASGRHHQNISEFEQTLGFMGWVISAGGAVVRHAETQELLYEVTVPQDLGLELFHRGRELAISLLGYHRTGIFCDQPSEWISLYTRRTHHGHSGAHRYRAAEADLDDRRRTDRGAYASASARI
jgi:HAD superfamily hydrolase (TIGR01484 family)